MSKGYGWQCESAILPSKSNPIHNVDSKSILALKAIISQPSNLSRSKKDDREIKLYTTDKKRKFDQVFSIRKKKVELNYIDEESEKKAKVIHSLEAKAKLYDDIINGKEFTSNIALAGGG